MKHYLHNHYTQAAPLRQSEISQAQPPLQTHQDHQDTSITAKFKQFLIQNSPSYRRTIRPHTVDQNTRMNMNNSMKKSAMYRKLLNSSHQRYTMTQQMARYRQKFQSATRKGIKDISTTVFRQFWEQEQKRKYTQSRQSKNETVGLRVQGRSKSSCKNRQNEIRSFEGFIDSQKRSNKKVNQQNYNLISITVGDDQQQNHLKISGNHKELKNKQKANIFKKLGLRKNKTQKLAKDIKVNPQDIPFQELEQKQKKEQEQKEIEKSIRNSHTRENSGRGVTYGTSHFKNLYSPYNGIQIKYLTHENQPIELHPSSRKLLPKNNYPQRSYYKKKNAEIKDSSIVFKEKGKKKSFQNHSVEGWKVQQEFHQDISDLCHHS